MSSEKRHFIVIDDNKLDCFIAEKIILNTQRSESVRTFLDSQEALAVISKTAAITGAPTNVIIVDIQMPLMNGFEFVEAFEKLDPAIKSSYAIFMLTSSINDNDLNRIHQYESVKDLLNKPLSVPKLSAMMDKL